MNPISLDELKRIELEIMDEIHSICLEHNLSYVLAYGTALGAVRHKGFIPWDDDLDIHMLRSDYEVFIKNFEQWKSSNKYSLSFCRTNFAPYPFAKVVDSRTIVFEKGIRRAINKEISEGIWVDIFPLDEEPVEIEKVYQKNRKLRLRRGLAMGNPKDEDRLWARIVKSIIGPLAGGGKKICKLALAIDNNALACKKNNSPFYYDIVGNENIDIKWKKTLFKPILTDFEDRKYFIMSGYEEYLDVTYGDWRVLPEESSRFAHACEVYYKS